MENPPVRIQSHHSSNPAKQEFYTLICHGHRVRTIVTATPAVVRRWIHRIRYLHRHQLRRGRLVVGLGVQWAPGRSTTSPATLQLCIAHHCLVFQLQHAALRRFLSDAAITFVGVWNYMDAGLLQASRHRLQISRLLEVRIVASALRGLSRSLSMARLAEEILGWEGVEKKERVGRSAWDQEWLNEEQVEYARVDAFLVFMMAKVLRVWNWGK